MLTAVSQTVNPINPNAEQVANVGMFRDTNAKALVTEASKVAFVLSDMIEKQGLICTIAGKKYVKFEGWQTLAAMLGLSVREVETHQTDDITFVSTVQVVRANDGFVLGQASAECGLDWEKKPQFARRSMALTRAAGKALRLNLAWIVSIAGYEATPAEEMMEIATTDTKPPIDTKPPVVWKITSRQKKLLEARISESSLERERVKNWMERAFGVLHFQDLTESQFQIMLGKIEGWKKEVQEGVDRLTS